MDQQNEFTEAFEEWKRRYDADPTTFMSCEEFEADPPKSYGEAAARYFIKLLAYV
jgi:hypothetical protein